MDADAKHALITRNLEEVLGDDDLRSILKERDLKVYWGTAPTGAPHAGYFVPLMKLGDFLSAGCEVTVLLADLHAYLDNMKSTWDTLKYRLKYYEEVIKALLVSIGVPIEKLRFVRGTDYQLSKEYTLDVYKMASICSTHHAQRAGAEVVKQVDDPLLSGLLYPLLQALDEEYLKVDAQFGGVDQRKIFALAREFLSKDAMGYKKRVHLMNPMVQGLTGGKMSASDGSSKIDLLDSAKTVKKKVGSAFCEEGAVEGNGVLSFVKHVLFPLHTRADEKEAFVIERPEQYGGNVAFQTYEELEAAFIAKTLYPLDLKAAVSTRLNALLEPIRKHFESDEMQDLIDRAYPGRAAGRPRGKKAAGKKQQKGGGGEDASMLDCRVARVVSVRAHDKSDKLYVAELQASADEAKGDLVQVVCGFADKIPVDEFKDKLVVAVVNMKPSKFKGVDSAGVVLAATNKAMDAPPSDADIVELVLPPEGAQPGDIVVFPPGYELQDPMPVLNPKKKTFQKKIQPHLSVNGDGVAVFRDDGVFTVAGKGTCTVKTLKNAKIL